MNEGAPGTYEILEKSYERLSYRYFRDRITGYKESRKITIPIMGGFVTFTIICMIVITVITPISSTLNVVMIFAVVGIFAWGITWKPKNYIKNVEINTATGEITIKFEFLSRKDTGSITRTKVKILTIDEVKYFDVYSTSGMKKDGKWVARHVLSLVQKKKLIPLVLFETDVIEEAVELKKIVKKYITFE
ncbi:MAG: hypothetical protein ACFFCS_15425 [Candidatus Hodarchaeota archaeon]